MSSKDLFLEQRAMQEEEHRAVDHGGQLPKMDSVAAITLANEVAVVLRSDFELPNGFRERAQKCIKEILSLK